MVTVLVLDMCVNDDDIVVVSLELVDNSRVVAERHLQVFADWKPCINDDDNEVERLALNHGFDDLFSMFNVSVVGVV